MNPNEPPSRPDLDQYRPPENLWKSAEDALIAGGEAALDRLLLEHGEMFRDRQPPSSGSGGLRPDYSGGNARTVIARNHHFEDWGSFERFLYEREREDSAAGQFEACVEAIAGGDSDRLKRLLRLNPELIRARSMRKHRATLLHYVGSNGIEYFRQRTPKNIPEIARILLQAGAEVNAVADIYGGSSALELAATSIHPAQAGVLAPLLEVLLEAGAAIDGSRGVASVNACLANGRPAGAEFLAAHGARLDLEGAAGLGRLDLVESFFQADGTMTGNPTREQMKSGFAWACEYGHTEVVEYLLEKGIDVNARLRNHGQTGLHWAASGGHANTVRALLDRKAEVNAKDETWGSTPLDWAMFAWNHPPPDGAPENYYEVIGMLVAAGAVVKPEWLQSEKVKSNADLLAALLKENGGGAGS